MRYRTSWSIFSTARRIWNTSWRNVIRTIILLLSYLWVVDFILSKARRFYLSTKGLFKGLRVKWVLSEVFLIRKKARRQLFLTRNRLPEWASRGVNFIFFLWSFVTLVGNKANFQSGDYSTCVAYTRTIIQLSVGGSGGYLPHLFPARYKSTTNSLHWGE